MPKIYYTTDGNMLRIDTGIKPVGQVRTHIVDDLQQDFYDEKDNLIKVEIAGLHRLPRMEQSRVIAEWEAPAVKKGKQKVNDHK